MTKISTDNLIDNIISEGRIKRNFSAFKTYFKWVFYSIIYLGIISSYFGIREDFFIKIKDIFYFCEITLLALLILVSLLSACFIAIPDFAEKKQILYLPFIFLGAFVICLLILIKNNDVLTPIDHTQGIICVGCITFSSLIPAILLFLEVKKAAPTKLYFLSFYIILYATSLSAFALRLENLDPSIYQTILYHYLPVLILSLLGGLFTKKLLRW